VKPDRLLWQGMVILVLLSLLGVILPLGAISMDLISAWRWLFWPFVAVFALLIYYFAHHALRLSTRARRRSATDTEPAQSDPARARHT
jgi:hypothetical protein